MALLSIPTSSDPFYTQITNLDGSNFILSFKFNQRENVWYMSIATSAGALLIAGIKIVCRWDLLKDFKAIAGLPLGTFAAFSQTPDETPPGLNELGEGARVQLYYASVT